MRGLRAEVCYVESLGGSFEAAHGREGPPVRYLREGVHQTGAFAESFVDAHRAEAALLRGLREVLLAE